MDYFPDESEYSSLHDMIEVDMHTDTDVDGPYPQTDIPVGKHSIHQIPMSPNNNSHHQEINGYGHHQYIQTSNHQQHEHQQIDQSPSIHSTSTGHTLSLPHKIDLDSSVSNLSWLHNVNLTSLQQQQQQQQENCNPNLLVNPQTVTPINNNNSSVHSNPVQVIEVSLPSNVQISGGNIQYVTVPSSTHQVYITTGKSTMSSQQQVRSTNGYGNYITSPNSAPSSTVADNPFPKPAYSYSCLIAMALKNSKHGSLPVAEIYNFMTRHFPYFKTAPDGWKNSVRHNLSLNKCFEKIENPNPDGTNSRKGCLWALNPAKIKKMDDEIAKWNKKDPAAIKRSMANPEMLELLEKGQGGYLTQSGQRVSQPLLQSMHHPIQHRSISTTRIITPSHLHHPGTQHITIGPGQQLHSNGSGHLLEQTKLAEDAADLFGGHADLPLDPSLSELALQNGIWDDLPADILDIPLSNSPTSFLNSPKKPSPVMSPENRYVGAHILNGKASQSHDTSVFATPTRVVSAL